MEPNTGYYSKCDDFLNREKIPNSVTGSRRNYNKTKEKSHHNYETKLERKFHG